MIAIGLNNELVAYRDVNVAQFDMNGISSLNSVLVRQERQGVIRDLINCNILIDLEEFASFRETFRRLSKYPWIWFIIKSINFVIRKYEKHL